MRYFVNNVDTTRMQVHKQTSRALWPPMELDGGDVGLACSEKTKIKPGGSRIVPKLIDIIVT